MLVVAVVAVNATGETVVSGSDDAVAAVASASSAAAGIVTNADAWESRKRRWLRSVCAPHRAGFFRRRCSPLHTRLGHPGRAKLGEGYCLSSMERPWLVSCAASCYLRLHQPGQKLPVPSYVGYKRWQLFRICSVHNATIHTRASPPEATTPSGSSIRRPTVAAHEPRPPPARGWRLTH